VPRRKWTCVPGRADSIAVRSAYRGTRRHVCGSG
jgi:hypothetical protein